MQRKEQQKTILNYVRELKNKNSKYHYNYEIKRKNRNKFEKRNRNRMLFKNNAVLLILCINYFFFRFSLYSFLLHLEKLKDSN